MIYRRPSPKYRYFRPSACRLGGYSIQPAGKPDSDEHNLAGTTISNPGVLPTPRSLISNVAVAEFDLRPGVAKFQHLDPVMFQFLEITTAAKILAEPRLLANTGEKAKFLSGGEIPIVIAQALNSSIVFKEFGTKVNVCPNRSGMNDIELLVQPEVSEPDYVHGVQLFGFTVPAFVTRKAETQVRLRDNQTLILAGLILHEKKEIIQKSHTLVISIRKRAVPQYRMDDTETIW